MQRYWSILTVMSGFILLNAVTLLYFTQKIPREVEQKAERILAQDEAYQTTHISIKGRDVVLSGVVPTPEAKQSLLEAFRNQPGFRHVIDQLNTLQPKGKS